MDHLFLRCPFTKALWFQSSWQSTPFGRFQILVYDSLPGENSQQGPQLKNYQKTDFEEFLRYLAVLIEIVWMEETSWEKMGGMTSLIPLDELLASWNFEEPQVSGPLPFKKN